MALVASLLDCGHGLLATAHLFSQILLRPSLRFSQAADLKRDLCFSSSLTESRRKGGIPSQPAHLFLKVIHRPKRSQQGIFRWLPESCPPTRSPSHSRP